MNELKEIVGAGGGGGGCFRAGTQVQLTGGKTKSIEDIKVGDEVIAFDEEGKLHLSRVLEVHYHEDAQPILEVRYWRGKMCGITPNHWVLNQYESFVEMGSMTTHDALVDGMGHLRPIIDAKLVGHEPVWNLTVETHHTFIADGIRVHNGGHRARYPEVVGAGGGGGGGKGGGGGGRASIEADDSLQSRASVGIIDLLGEGEIGGLVNGARSIFLNETPLQNADGSYNFSDVTWHFRPGTQNQLPITGSSAFDAISSPVAVSVQLKKDRPHSVTIANPLANQVMVVMAVPSLMSQDKTTGDINGSSVSYRIEMSINGGAFINVGSHTISGKTRSRYQRSHMIDLPPGGLRVIRVVRETDDSASAALNNDLYFDSFVERVTTILNYPNCALAGITVNAAQFTSIPRRAYLVDGLYIRVPSNYDPVTRTYTGIWNGSFKLAVSNNPAWILYDLLTVERYGLGDYIKAAQVDKATLYQIGRYCDELVSNGMGGYEPRFVCNVVINTLQDAYKLIGQIGSVFRGMGFWNGSGVGFMYDAPRDASVIFNRSNVIDGKFNYVGSARKNRHSVALITWNDPEESYKQKIEYVEDAELIAKFGVRKIDMVGFGCTSRSQAHRIGRWILYTEKEESQIINFRVGIEAAMVMPGEVAQLHDDMRAGKRLAGRIRSATATSVTLDAPVQLSAALGIQVGMRMPDGSYVERNIKETSGGTFATLTWDSPLASIPLTNSVFVVIEPTLKPLSVRIVGVAQGDKPNTFTITALQHNPSKFDSIEKGYVLERNNTSIIDTKAATAPVSLLVTEELYSPYPSVLTTRLAVSWSGTMPSYEVSYRRSSGSDLTWKTFTTSYQSVEIEDIRKGTYEFQIRGINAFGNKSATYLHGTHNVVGKIHSPGDVVNFKVSKRQADLLLSWDNVQDIDLAGYEVRCGASWDSGEILMTRFMGNSMVHDQSEAGSYTYFVRSIDKVGNYSENPAVFVLDLAAPTPVEQFNVVQSGNRLDFRWRPNPESDIAGYELREGMSWALSVKIGEVNATSFTYPAGAAGTRYFWIAAIASPGIYGKTPMMTTYNVAEPSDRNVVFEDNQSQKNFPGRKIEATAGSGELTMSAGAMRSEYIFDINLPTTYRAQNILYHGAQAIMADPVQWSSASFSWESPQANRQWVQTGNSTAIAVRYQMAPAADTGMLAGEIDGWAFDNGLASVKGGATVVESKNPNYTQGRYKGGVHVTDTTRLSWNVAIPAIFSKTFWIIPKSIGDATYISLTNGGDYLRLRYSLRDEGFKLIGSDGKSILVPWTITIDKPICVGICQTSTKRRLLIGGVAIDSPVAAEVDATPITTFASVKLY